MTLKSPISVFQLYPVSVKFIIVFATLYYSHPSHLRRLELLIKYSIHEQIKEGVSTS
jgi:hypothetical protein